MPKYVGNRCIPMPMGNWDKNKEYENLSVVLASNGDSYTSKKNVPKGIELSNTEYWVISGNYNAQVAEYKEIVEKEIQDRKNADKDNILWIGDSYSVNYNHKLPNGVRDMLNAKNWYEHSRGGAGFVGAWGGIDFNGLIEEAKNEMTDTQKEMIKYVYIVGGANDSHFTWEEIRPKVISTVANARNSFPNAQVVFIFASSAFNTFLNVYSKTLKISNDNLVPCIFAMPHYYLTGAFYNDDNVHYTQGATNYIISVISNSICGSNYLPTFTISNANSCFEGWTAITKKLQFSAPTGSLKISTPYLALSKSTEEPFETNEYGNTILLKSIPISNENRFVIPLRPTRIFVHLKIKNVIYTDYLECELNDTTHQLIWTTDNSYPATKDMIIKIIG